MAFAANTIVENRRGMGTHELQGETIFFVMNIWIQFHFMYPVRFAVIFRMYESFLFFWKILYFEIITS